MREPEQIEHRGIIKEINKNELKINILSITSCASCNLKGACGVSEVEEKTIEVYTEDAHLYKTNETVDVFYKQSLGFRALFLGYILPFIIVLFSLVISMTITKNEGISGIISLVILVPYYLILYLTRKNLKNTFSFSVKKTNVKTI